MTGNPAAIMTTGQIKSKWFDQTFAEVALDGKAMRFAATGSSSVKRTRTLFTKEPVTLAWIDTFLPGEMLFDIGANVGVYTIYAAVMRGSRVFAFEPEALNYAELNKNIFLNDLHARVTAYCLALSDKDKADVLLLSDFGLGISYHDFEENSWVGDKEFSPDWKVSRDNRREQGCVGRRLDSLIAEGLPVPHHIKIDVDGLEHRVILGMLETLAQPELKTVLIEINFDNPRNLALIDTLTEMGWRYSMHQLCIHRRFKFTAEQVRRLHERGEGGMNYIFYRDSAYDGLFERMFNDYVPGEPIACGELPRPSD